MCSAKAAGSHRQRARVGIAAVQLVDAKSHLVISPERWLYAVELTNLLLDLGYQVAWWQLGSGFCAEVVPGVPLWGTLSAEAQFGTYPQASEEFFEQASGVDWAIYFDSILAYPQVHACSIAIDHGVYWDHALFEASLRTESGRDEWRRRLWSAYAAPRAVAAVDTGTIQWATSTWPGLHHRFVYIPNFVPRPREQGASATFAEGPGKRESLRVLFPSALRPSEGVSETVRAIEQLSGQGRAYQFYMTGEGTAEVQSFVQEWARKYAVHYLPQPLTGALLDEVDVVIFPAKSGQGTSMACLQAMAAGKAVVVAQTGGLTDIVLHDHNGLVIQPRAERLVRALEGLRQDPEHRRYLGQNARLVAEHFSLERWRGRWARLTETIIN